MKWSFVNMWCEGHIFFGERHVSPFGDTSAALWVPPLRGPLRSVGTTFGSPVSAPHKSQNPLRYVGTAFGSPDFAPHKSKNHTKACFVIKQALAALATKPKTKATKPHKSVIDESRRRWRSAQNQTSAGHKSVLGEQ